MVIDDKDPFPSSSLTCCPFFLLFPCPPSSAPPLPPPSPLPLLNPPLLIPRYDYESVKSSRTFASPLGRTAAVNWVTCRDIGRVAAVALLDPSWDGQVLDVTGPPSSTLTAGEMSSSTLISFLQEGGGGAAPKEAYANSTAL